MGTIGERPGVYASYEVTGVSYSGVPAGTVGVAAQAAGGVSGTLYEINSYGEAAAVFGEDAAVTKLAGVLIKNGVRTVKAVPVAEKDEDLSGYESAFRMLAAESDVKMIICDRRDRVTAAYMKAAITGADERNIHKIGIIEGDGDVTEDTAFAKTLNSERMVLVTPPATEGGAEAQAGTLAAAVAGALTAEPDPAVPLNGAELYGIEGVAKKFTDGEVTTLVRGGATPIECVGGVVTAVRGITTRTESAGVPDATYREITTTLIIDNVIPTIRNALAASFARSKNTAQTRGAIRTRVILELEKKLAAEIIDGYDNVKVSVNKEDPTVCDVSFEFTVAHGLNQIRLTACITV